MVRETSISVIHMGINKREDPSFEEIFEEVSWELCMEAATMANGQVAHALFGSLQHPIAMMEHEHDSAGGALRVMRDASNGFVAPVDACISFQTLYRTLAGFEADLHQHIHL